MEADKSVATRYDANFRAGVYLYWRTVGGRSISKCSKHFNVDYNSVKLWIDRDNWITSANQEDHDDFSSSRIGVAAIVVNELVPSILEAVRIRDYGSDDKVRLAAAQWLAGLAGVSPVNRVETSFVQAPKHADTIDVQSLAKLSPAELMALEQQVRAKRNV